MTAGASLLGLEDKVVVVTGSSRGVGRGCAVQFARAGAHVVIVARGIEGAEDAAAEIRGLGRESLAVKADVRQEGDVDRMVASALGRFGRIDVAINNVGGREGEPKGTLLESGPGYWRETEELNLYTVLLNSRAFARAMIERATAGVILNVASVTAFKATPGLAPYAAAKAGVIQLTRTLARELAPHGIRVNCVAPGMVDTDSLREYLSEQALQERASTLPSGRIATPEDIGKVAVLLASDLSEWVVGQTLVADGGEALGEGS